MWKARYEAERRQSDNGLPDEPVGEAQQAHWKTAWERYKTHWPEFR
jgi:hypothetical protein